MSILIVGQTSGDEGIRLLIMSDVFHSQQHWTFLAILILARVKRDKNFWLNYQHERFRKMTLRELALRDSL